MLVERDFEFGFLQTGIAAVAYMSAIMRNE